MIFRLAHIQYFCREVERQKDGPEYVAGMAKGFALLQFLIKGVIIVYPTKTGT